MQIPKLQNETLIYHTKEIIEQQFTKSFILEMTLVFFLNKCKLLVIALSIFRPILSTLVKSYPIKPNIVCICFLFMIFKPRNTKGAVSISFLSKGYEKKSHIGNQIIIYSIICFVGGKWRMDHRPLNHISLSFFIFLVIKL